MKTKKEIAIAFSNGNFNMAYEYLDDNVIWEVVGDSIFNGKKEVIANCDRTAYYFQSVETIFDTEDVQVFGNVVMVRGTAEFKRDGKRISFVKACDVYIFGNEGNIQNIHSYCIPDK